MEIKITLNGIERTVTKNQIFELAAKGTIRPDTNINVDGRQIAAAKIKGIVFDESSNNSTPSPTKPSASSPQKTISNPAQAKSSAPSPSPQKTVNDPTPVFAPLSDLPNDFPSFDFPQQEFANNSAPSQSSQYSFSARSRSHRNPNAGNGSAVASFVFGICSLVFCGGLLILPLIGLVLGLFGVKSKNQGMAIAGIVMSCIGFLFAIASIFVLIPAVQAARSAAFRISCASNESKIVNAILGFHEKHNALPARYTVDENNKPLHSWRVLILPFLGENKLYEKIRLDEPWDSEHNKQFHSQMPSVYACPGNHNEKTHKCCYSAIAGNGAKGNEGALTPAKEAKQLTGITNLKSIARNLNEIILIVEVREPFCWMDPLADKTFNDLETIGTRHGDVGNVGFNAALGNGQIMFFANSIDQKLLKEMVTRRGTTVFPVIPQELLAPKTINLPKISEPEPKFSDPMKRNSLSIPKTNVPKPITPKKDQKTKTTTPKKEPKTTKPTKTTTPKKEPATPRRRTRPSKDDDDQDLSQHTVIISTMLASA